MSSARTSKQIGMRGTFTAIIGYLHFPFNLACLPVPLAFSLLSSFWNLSRLAARELCWFCRTFSSVVRLLGGAVCMLRPGSCSSWPFWSCSIKFEYFASHWWTLLAAANLRNTVRNKSCYPASVWVCVWVCASQWGIISLTVGHQDHRQQKEPQTKCNSSNPTYCSKSKQ